MHTSEWRVYRKEKGKKWIATHGDVALAGTSEEDLRTNVREYCIERAAEQKGVSVDGLMARLKRTWLVKVAADRKVLLDDDDDDCIRISLFD